MGRPRGRVSDRWAARPFLGASLRVLALLGPVAVGFGVALLLAAVLPAPVGAPASAVWWGAVLAGSAATVFVSDRLARRLLPLAILLELSLIFPDRAPSRLRAARTSSVRDLDRRLARLRGDGVPMEPYEAAETVVTLVGILGLHDKRTRGHSERVRAFTDLLTNELGLDEPDRMRLRWAALVHDLGKLTVPATVLNGAGALDEDGWTLMHRHPEEGERLLSGLLPWLGEWGDAVLQHHERWDGTGYPRGLAGEQISYAGRIVALADSFEVMTSGRSYKASRSAAWARGEITRCAGSQFDPALVRAFLGISLGRLRWILGPVTWLAEMPFVATADRAGQTVKVASVTALTAGLLVTGLPPGGTGTPAPDGGGVASAGGGTNRDFDVAALLGDADALDRSAAQRHATGSGPAPASSPAPAPAPAEAAGPAASDGQPPGADEAPQPEPAARPTPAAPGAEPQKPTARPASAPAPDVYHLSRSGLVLSPPPQQEIVSAALEQPVVFDRRLDRDTVLPNGRELVLHIQFPSRQGAAKVAVRLLDCPARSSSGCTLLSTGGAAQDKTSTEEFRRYDMPLLRTRTAPQTVAAGRVLRVEVLVREPGAKAPARFALGSSATPSRLALFER